MTEALYKIVCILWVKFLETEKNAHICICTQRENTENNRQYSTIGCLWILVLCVGSEVSPGSRYSESYKQWIIGCIEFSILLSCSFMGLSFSLAQIPFSFHKEGQSQFQRVGVIFRDKDNETYKIIFREQLLVCFIHCQNLSNKNQVFYVLIKYLLNQWTYILLYLLSVYD